MIVSIIIPCYNRENLILETFESIKNQTYKDWEVIVVDDQSQDSTQKIVKEYCKNESRMKLLIRPSELAKGANSCRNLGFQHAQGKYIKFLDSDDLLTPNALRRQVDALESNGNLQVCLSYGRFFNNETKELEEFWSRNKDFPDFLLGNITNKIRWAVSDPLWRKSFFSQPPFKEGLMNSQEWLMHNEAWLRLEKKQICNLEECFSLIRRGNLRMSSNISSNYYKNQMLSRYFLLRKVISNGLTNRKVYWALTKQIIVFSFWRYRYMLIN